MTHFSPPLRPLFIRLLLFYKMQYLLVRYKISVYVFLNLAIRAAPCWGMFYPLFYPLFLLRILLHILQCRAFLAHLFYRERFGCKPAYRRIALPPLTLPTCILTRVGFDLLESLLAGELTVEIGK